MKCNKIHTYTKISSRRQFQSLDGWIRLLPSSSSSSNLLPFSLYPSIPHKPSLSTEKKEKIRDPVINPNNTITTMATLQASLLSKPSLPFPFSFPSLRHHHTLSLNPLPLSNNSHPTRLRSRVPSTSLCTFRSDGITSPSEPEPGPTPTPSGPGSKPDAVDGGIINSTEEKIAVSDWNEPSSEGIIGAESSESVLQSGGEEGVEGKSANLKKKKKEEDEEGVVDSRLPLVVFFVGLWARAREGVGRAFSEFYEWWPFWRQEKRLARLIADAEANPQDAAKQSALFVELNKHRSVWRCCRLMNECFGVGMHN